MSLSDQNRALIERVRQPGEYAVMPAWIDRLLDAARAEGVAALQQAGEPVAWIRNEIAKIISGAPFPSKRSLAKADEILAKFSPLPQQTALVEEGVEKIIAQHEPAACGEGTLPSPSEPPLSAEEVELPNYWRAVVGDSYKPAVLRNVKHMHPTTVKEVFDRYAGTDVADVIAGLIFKNQIANNRSEFFAEEYAKATAAPPPPTDGEVK